MANITRQIVKTVADEFGRGLHQRNPIDLPFELQFRLECSWGHALNYANDIRIKAEQVGR